METGFAFSDAFSTFISLGEAALGVAWRAKANKKCLTLLSWNWQCLWNVAQRLQLAYCKAQGLLSFYSKRRFDGIVDDVK